MTAPPKARKPIPVAELRWAMMPALHLATQQFFSEAVWMATTQAVANLAAFVAVTSAVCAWITYREQQYSAEVADAAGVGLALGLIPGLVFAVFVYVNVATSGVAPQ